MTEREHVFGMIDGSTVRVYVDDWSLPGVRQPQAVVGDLDCPYCGGSGERFWHTPDCRSDFCALAGGYDDCAGQVERCPCIPYPPAAVPPVSGQFARLLNEERAGR